MSKGLSTQMEINSQADIWRSVIQQFGKEWQPLQEQAQQFAGKPLVVTGCGSTYYLSLATAAVLRSAGVQAWAFPASELVYFPLEQLPAGYNMLAISRSGTTTETLWAVERYRASAPAGKLAVITCVPDSPLAQQADLLLGAAQAHELSVAQTRSFTSMCLMGRIFTALLTNQRADLERLTVLPQALERLFAGHAAWADQLGADLSIDRFFFLGNGALNGIASEAMLKTKEMTCSWAEAYHTLEFRHGPMSVVSQSALVVGLISDSAPDAELQVLREMKALGGRTLALIEKVDQHSLEGIDTVIELSSGLSELERGALYLPLIHRLAFARAIQKGLDPDQPVNLSAVVFLGARGTSKG